MAAGGRLEETTGRASPTTVFVADPSSEAEGVSLALRAAGHHVVDVQTSMLVARVAVQRPRIVLVDADAEGALDVVERMRELPDADDIHVLFIARPGGAIGSPEEALAHEGSGLFVRPVDVGAVVHKVQALSGGAPDGAEQPVAPPVAAGLPTSAQKPPSTPPSLPPASMRASLSPPGLESKSSAPPSPRSRSPSEPPMSLGGASSRKVMGLAPPVSPELQQLLAEAEQRVHVQAETESIVPSPEDEIEAVLPADLLAALDEPLEEDEDEDDPVIPARPGALPGAGGRDRTGLRAGGRGSRASASSPGSAVTSDVPRSGPGARQSETPPAPHTHGGTHAGPTGEGISTTGASDAHDRSEPGALRAAPRPAASAPPPLAPLASAPPPRKSVAPPRAKEAAPPVVLGAGDAVRLVARAIAARTTGSLCVATPEVERRVVLREGDVVTTSSNAEDESLLAFLGVRGDLPRETVRRLGSKFPPYGRHAGAALVARGYVRQDQMWPTLRAHAEWLFARALQTSAGRLVVEPQPPGRLGGEPSVFGGSTGASVFVEVMRRIVPPADALERLGGASARVAEGAEARLLGECALEASELEQVRAAAGRPLRDLLEVAPETDLATVLYALAQLGVVEVTRTTGANTVSADEQSAPDVAALDAEAVRERVRARLQLVEDGDYFALLGVSRDATGYEVRRAFLELRRAFEPARVLTPEVDDLAEDVRKITSVLEEAYDILKDAARRERYRRAIEAAPER
ncbi:MAG: hypothetical protein JOZ69_13775 [Myxococcales bacterium]|nr:hypothetical protein [Myxococcales bacterium]